MVREWGEDTGQAPVRDGNLHALRRYISRECFHHSSLPSFHSIIPVMDREITDDDLLKDRNLVKRKTTTSYLTTSSRRSGRLRGLVGSALDLRSLLPEFEFHVWFRLITFHYRSAHLVYHVHKRTLPPQQIVTTTKTTIVLTGRDRSETTVSEWKIGKIIPEGGADE